MHEAGIAMSVLETALAAAEREGARKVLRVEVRVGALAGVVPEALRFAFDALKAGTIASGSELAITKVPVEARCVPCGRPFEVTDGWAVVLCPACGEPSGTVSRGEELVIEALEVV